MSMQGFNLRQLSKHTIYVCSYFELFILVELQKTVGLPSSMLIFAGSASLIVVVYVLAQSFLFGHIKYFL